MATIINMATAEQREQFLNGGKEKTSRPRPQPVYVKSDYWVNADRSIELQLPIIVHAQHGYARASRAAHAAATKKHVEQIILALRAWLPWVDRERIDHITFVRISLARMDAHDNLPYAFKHVFDATAAWVLRGNDDIDFKRIGQYDKQLTELGRVSWSYEQRTNDEEVKHRPRKKPQGIRIRFRLS